MEQPTVLIGEGINGHGLNYEGCFMALVDSFVCPIYTSNMTSTVLIDVSVSTPNKFYRSRA